MDDDAELRRSFRVLEGLQARLGLQDAPPAPPANPPATGDQQRKPKGRPRASLARHNRKCNICRHPDRDAIEQDFLRWRSPERIARDYGFADHSSVYRHVHATGLFARRRGTLRFALESIIEQAEHVKPNASAIVKAVYACAHINDAGEWIESPKTYIIMRADRSAPSSVATPPKHASPPLSNRQDQEIEHAATR